MASPGRWCGWPRRGLLRLRSLHALFVRGGAYTERSARANAARPGDLTGAAPDYLTFTGSLGYEADRAAIALGGAYEAGASTATYSLQRREIRIWVAGSYRLSKKAP